MNLWAIYARVQMLCCGANAFARVPFFDPFGRASIVSATIASSSMKSLPPPVENQNADQSSSRDDFLVILVVVIVGVALACVGIGVSLYIRSRSGRAVRPVSPDGGGAAPLLLTGVQEAKPLSLTDNATISQSTLAHV